MSKSTLLKLEEVFAYDATVEEACFYADITPSTYYLYIKENPEFSERVQALRQRPILAARKKVVETIKSDSKNAQWYLERKRKNEFAQRTELAGGGEDPIHILLQKYELNEDKPDDRKGDDAKADPSTQEVG